MRLLADRRRMLTILLSLCVALILVAGLLVAWPGPLVALLERAAPGCTWRVDTDAPVAALTFDDGPDPEHTPAVLEILASHDVAATFFLVGERAREHPDLVHAIREAGHEIGNHGDTWRSARSQSDAELELELLAAERTLGLRGAESPKLFRPAGGIIRPEQLRVVGEHGYRCILGSAYGLDAHAPPAALISWMIRRGLEPGAIVVMHDAGGDRSGTVEALPEIIEEAGRRGLRFVRTSELLELAGAQR